MFKNRKTIKRIVSISAAAVCTMSALRFMPALKNETFAADELTAFEITKEMKIGWNIGNSLDATAAGSNPGLSTETAWGNPKITKELIDAVKAKGFNTIRIPTTWYQHLDADNNIDPEWMARVHEVVDYCYDNDMYIILNLHHEEWVNRADLGTAYDEMAPKLLKIWQQIADEFTNYDQHLIFECMNEPRAVGTTHEWWGPEQSEVNTINNLNADFVELIRNDDSPYADTRLLMIPGYCAASDISMISKIAVPDDDYVAVSIHAYVPYNFTMNSAVADHSVFTDSYKAELKSILEGIRSTFIAEDIPVVIGEFGTSNFENTDARVEWANAYISQAKSIGVPCVLWDNNTITNPKDPGECHGYINRRTLEWYEISEPVIAEMMDVLADDSIVWGSEGKGPEYIHSSIDSGKTLTSSSQSIDASIKNGNCTGNYDVSWAALQGKEIAIKFTGDVPLACFMDSEWGNWTQLNPYDVDKKNGIAYYSYEDIKSAWTASSEPAHLCAMTMGVTTVDKISLIDAATIKEPGTDDPQPTDPVKPTDPVNPTDPVEPTTPGNEDFVFETLFYNVDISERVQGGSVITLKIEGEPSASVGGCVGYGTNEDDWVNIEWSTNLDNDGAAEVVVDISDIPEELDAAQVQIWWSNVWNASTETAKDYPCEMVDYKVETKGMGDILYGDVNNSGDVEVADAIAVMSYVTNAEKFPLTAEQQAAADVYQSGDGVGINDAVSIQKYLTKLIKVLPES